MPRKPTLPGSSGSSPWHGVGDEHHLPDTRPPAGQRNGASFGQRVRRHLPFGDIALRKQILGNAIGGLLVVIVIAGAAGIWKALTSQSVHAPGTTSPVPTLPSAPITTTSESTLTSTTIDTVGDTRLASGIAFSSADVPSTWVGKTLPAGGDSVGVSGCVATIGSTPTPSGDATTTFVDRSGTIYSNQISSYIEVFPSASSAISLYRREGESDFLNCLRTTNEDVLKQQGLEVSSSKGNFLPNTSIGDERFTDETVFQATSNGFTTTLIEDLIICREGRGVGIYAFISLAPPFPPDLAEKLFQNIDNRLRNSGL